MTTATTTTTTTATTTTTTTTTTTISNPKSVEFKMRFWNWDENVLKPVLGLVFGEVVAAS